MSREVSVNRINTFVLSLFILLSFSNLPIKAQNAISGLRSGDATFDNGKRINEAASDNSVLVIPSGTYYFSTPIVIEKPRVIECYGSLVYIGKSGVSAITIKGNNKTIFFYGAVSALDNKNISYDNYSDRNCTIGVDFVNVNNSHIYLSEVKFFNENVRVSGLGGGCCYNEFTFGVIRNANVGLRIYQADRDGKRGWANENLFLGGRFCNFSEGKTIPSPLAIKIAGAEDAKDSYNTSNSNHFTKQSFEHFTTIVYAKNTRYCDFLYGRLEDSKLFIKFIGSSLANRVNSDYPASCKLYDDTEATYYPIRLDTQQQFRIAEISRTAAKATNQYIEVSSADAKVFRITADNSVKVQICYLDGSGKPVSSSAAPLNSRQTKLTASKVGTNPSWTLDSAIKDLSFRIPDDIKSFRVYLSGSFSYAAIYSYSRSTKATVYD